MAQWIGIGLDGVLAQWQEGQDPDQIGLPIPAMVERLEQWIAQGYEVRVVTERALNALDAAQVEAWLDYHDLPELHVTHSIDGEMLALWHDRAIHVELNQGDIGAPSDLLAYIESSKAPANASQHELETQAVNDNFDVLDEVVDAPSPIAAESATGVATVSALDAASFFDQDDTGGESNAKDAVFIGDEIDAPPPVEHTKTVTRLHQPKPLSQEQLEAVLNDEADESDFEPSVHDKRLSDTSLDNLFETLDSPQFFKGA